jgi:hypothetical protein
LKADSVKPFASSSKLLSVYDPSSAFTSRKINSLQETLSKLGSFFDKTDLALRKGNGVSSAGYPREFEDRLRQIRKGAKTYVVLQHGEMKSQCNDEDKFIVRMLDGSFGKNVKGNYSISSHTNVDLTKSGSASGAKGIPGRTKDQVGSGIDLSKYVAVLSELEETKRWLQENQEAKRVVESIHQLLPSTMSYISVPLDLTINLLDECAVASALPGDPNLLGETFLNMGDARIHNCMNFPSPRLQELNAGAAEWLAPVRQLFPFFTWITELSNIYNQITNGKTSTGKVLDTQTCNMVRDMVHMNPVFMQQFMVCVRLLGGMNESVTVHDFRNALSTNPVGDAMAELAEEILECLPFTIDELGLDTLLEKLTSGLQNWYLKDESFFDMESQIGSYYLNLGPVTKAGLLSMIEDAIRSGESEQTAILLEKLHEDVLRRYCPETYDMLFGKNPHVRNIYSHDVNGRIRVAGRVCLVKGGVKLVTTSSYFNVNAPNRAFEMRANLCAEMLAVKGTFVQAGLMSGSHLSKLHEQLRAFLIQVKDPFNQTPSTAREMFAIRNNSPNNYFWGTKGKVGLKALINLLRDALGIGIHSEVMASLAMHLGARGVEELLYALFGRSIDCSNMAEELKKLKEQQEDLGEMSDKHRAKIAAALTGRKLLQEHKDKIAAALTGRKLLQEHKDKIAAATTGRSFTDDHRGKLAAATTGRSFTDDHRDRLSAGIAAYNERERTAELERMRRDGVTIVKVRSESCPQGHEREVSLDDYNSKEKLWCLKCKAYTATSKWRVIGLLQFEGETMVP